MNNGIVVGIDLGTTNSVVCYSENQKYNFVKDETGKSLIPSVVCYSEETYVGAEAVDNEENFPDKTIRSSKRFIGQELELLPGVTPKNVAADILKYLKSIAEIHTNANIEGIVITVPAYFNQNQRLETKKAAEEAGLHVLRIINEPTAAALAYGQDAKQNELVLVYDLGGGTFDVTLLELSSDNVYHVLSTSGDTKLGGDDFDNLLIDYIKKDFPSDFQPFNDLNVRLKKFAEEVKVQLNYKKHVKRTLRYCGTSQKRLKHLAINISQEQYSEMITKLLLKTKSHVLNALSDADKKISQLSKIILVGGSTKSKFVREFVAENFNTKVYYEIDPDLTVAAGACNLAQSIHKKTDDGALLIDVTPLSLGIETKGGLLNKIIPRNTNIPVSSEQDYITAQDNQDSVNIRIFQGERPLAKDNAFLGEFVLSGFEKRPRGQTIVVVKFDIDASGLITVQAFDKISGIQSQVTLNPITSEQLNNMLEDLELNQESDKNNLQRIEIDKLVEEAKTMILTLKLKSVDTMELEETLICMKDNLIALKVFVQELKDA